MSKLLYAVVAVEVLEDGYIEVLTLEEGFEDIKAAEMYRLQVVQFELDNDGTDPQNITVLQYKYEQ